jgi:predicted GNAT family N-acyltransferase
MDYLIANRQEPTPMPTITTDLYPDATLPANLDALYHTWDRECFTEPNEYAWARALWHLFVRADGAPVSYIGLHARQATLDGAPLLIGGVGSVMTPTANRRQGYAAAGLERANHALRALTDAPFAQLITGPHLAPFYARFGWQPIPDPVLVRLADGRAIPLAGINMIQPLRDRPWPGGTLDLCGLPW